MRFANAYDEQDEWPNIDTLHCDPTDIMSVGGQVQWYHGRLLWERL
jgi:hypothetical protein